MKTIDLTICKEGQKAFFKETLAHKGHKVQVAITTDSVQRQSRLRVSVWSEQELKWSLVDYIPAAAMKTDPELAYTNSWNRKESYQQDRDHLLEMAKKILD